MSAMDHGRKLVVALAACGAIGAGSTMAQQGGKTPPSRTPPVPTRKAAAAAPAPVAGEAKAVPARIPVNPKDPVALVNGEKITREELANECLVRKGEEILETLIARKLIDQAVQGQKLQITQKEIDDEIDRVAMTMAGVNREAWLRTLARERNITPAQYARDIIYPTLALRKLALPRVQVTPDDLDRAFEALYGEKLKARIILVDNQRAGVEIWEELRKDPSRFEALAQTKSIDQGTRAIGGLLPAPISRHSEPATVSDAAFEQLVDGDDPKAKPEDKPQDGAISALIQVTESTWVILKREGVIPAQPVDRSKPDVQKALKEAVTEAKIQEEVANLYAQMTQNAAIENHLTGQVKLPNNGEVSKVGVDAQLMSNPAAALPPTTAPAAAAAKADAPGRAAVAPPGVSDADVKRAAQLKKH